jgi:protein-disulfide isomerase-like protein with CxxC motif
MSNIYVNVFQTNPEIVKRWSNEVQEAVQSRAALVQFHALALLQQVCINGFPPLILESLMRLKLNNK